MPGGEPFDGPTTADRYWTTTMSLTLCMAPPEEAVTATPYVPGGARIYPEPPPQAFSYRNSIATQPAPTSFARRAWHLGAR